MIESQKTLVIRIAVLGSIWAAKKIRDWSISSASHANPTELAASAESSIKIKTHGSEEPLEKKQAKAILMEKREVCYDCCFFRFESAWPLRRTGISIGKQNLIIPFKFLLNLLP